MSRIQTRAGEMRRAGFGITWTLVACLLVFTIPAQAGRVGFQAAGHFEQRSGYTYGSFEFTLDATEAIYQTGFELIGYGENLRLPGPKIWMPGETRVFETPVSLPGRRPGAYFILANLRFQDRFGVTQGISSAFPYRVGPFHMDPNPPRAEISGTRLSWSTAGLPAKDLRLSLTGTPAWRVERPLNPTHDRFTLEVVPSVRVAPDWAYPQLARLDWVRDGRQHSRIMSWTVHTDGAGLALEEEPTPPHGLSSLGEQPMLAALAIVLASLSVLFGGLRRRRSETLTRPESWVSTLLGWALVTAFTLWLVRWLHPELWSRATWLTGGDAASHLLYAARFSDWLLQEARISGWMPEVFMGLPAFLYYFPLPFSLIAALSPLTGLAVAVKWVSMLPALLLPAATYLLAGRLHWPAPARAGAALGAAGFLLMGAFSVWGGNLLSQLAGEFAYSWGFAATLLFWALLRWALDRGGYRWALAALAEAVVALCHGYPLLVAGFGAFFLIRLDADWKTQLRNVLLVHTTAFLLVAFWLIPLIENLPWSVPNDTTAWLDPADWLRLVDESVWPMLAGWLLIPIWVAICRHGRSGVFFFAAIALLGLVGYLWSSAAGLANVRFLPYTLWAIATLGGAAIGWALWRFSLRPWLWLLTGTIALLAWWSPLTVQIEAWSRWNLEGYEAKPLWPQYAGLARATAGPLSAPRVIFEHDPANTDLGSTRALEALPLFGSRPVLEGLYMESALCGPIVYQVQAEISARPSSPLSRFPSSRDARDLAVPHLEELYTDTLILRSQESIDASTQDERLMETDDLEPFRVFRIKDFSTRMVEPLREPIDVRPREHWLEQAFRRFRLDFPYERREVYTDGPNQELRGLTPAPTSSTPSVHLLSIEPERVVFETEAPGTPHLVRMSYHPRWRASSGEAVYLVEPCFMLVIPKKGRVELVYGRSTGDRLGLSLSILGAILFFLLLRRGPKVEPKTPSPPASRAGSAPILILIVGTAVAAWGWLANPQRIYMEGHRHFAAGDYANAAEQFSRAEAQRRHPARKAEALFWSARSLHLADNPLLALERYHSLAENTPESNWAPESVYREVELLTRNGDFAEAGEAAAKFRTRYPGNRWSEEVEKLVSGIGVPD